MRLEFAMNSGRFDNSRLVMLGHAGHAHFKIGRKCRQHLHLGVNRA
jgi:hypothetical protein